MHHENGDDWINGVAVAQIRLGQVVDKGKTGQEHRQGDRVTPAIVNRPAKSEKSQERDQGVRENMRQARLGGLLKLPFEVDK